MRTAMPDWGVIMRRDHIVKAVDKLRDALQAARIRELLRLAKGGDQTETVNRTQKVLLAYSVFSKHYQEFNEQEKELMAYFGLGPLLDINFWSSLIDVDNSSARKVLADVDVGAYNVIYVMPRLRDLLIRDNDQDVLMINNADGSEREVRRLRVMIVERTRQLTDPQLLVNVIRSVEELYESLATLRAEPEINLVIGAIDSGNAKSIDFFGNSLLIGEIATLLLDVWDRLKYSQEENYRYQIEVALMGAGFVGVVNDARAADAITEEQGQRITRRVAKAIETLFKSGAYTNDMDEPRGIRASEVLAPTTEMLEYKVEERRTGRDQSAIERGAEPMMRGHDALLRELGADRPAADEPAALRKPDEKIARPGANGDAANSSAA